MKTKQNPILFLLHGSDRGLLQDKAHAMIAEQGKVAKEAPDVLRLEGDALVAAPKILFEEMAAFPMFAKTRALVVELGARDLTRALEELLRDADHLAHAATKLYILASSLKKTSALRQLVEGHPLCFCREYTATPREAVEEADSAIFKPLGIVLDPEVKKHLGAVLSGTWLEMRGQLETLALYVGEHGALTQAIVDDAISNDEAATVDSLVDGIFLGRLDGLDDFLHAHGISSEVGDAANLARAQFALMKHAVLIYEARAMLAAGKPMGAALSEAGKSIFFKRKDAFAAQIRLWSLEAIAQAIDKLLDAQGAARLTPKHAASITIRALWGIAKRAREGAKSAA